MVARLTDYNPPVGCKRKLHSVPAHFRSLDIFSEDLFSEVTPSSVFLKSNPRAVILRDIHFLYLFPSFRGLFSCRILFCTQKITDKIDISAIGNSKEGFSSLI